MKTWLCTALAAGTVLANVVRAADPLTHWNIRQPSAGVDSENYEGVAYGNDTWVVVGGNGSILSSPDGVVWTPESNPLAPKRLDDVAFGNGIFVAIGRNANVMLTSPDGHIWTPQIPDLTGAVEIIHDGSRFVMIVSGGFAYTSTDGVHSEFIKEVPVNYDIGGFAFGNGVYVEAGYKRTGQPADLFSSGNLTDWTQRDAKLSQNFHNVGFGLGMFIAVGQGGAVITSPDGAEWTPRPISHTGFIWDVATGGKYVAAAAQWGRILWSTNGIDWTVYETDLTWHLTDIAFGKDTFVAVGWEEQIVQSDPILITPPGGTILLQQAVKAGDAFTFKFTAEVGKSYQVLASSDLKSWAPLTTITATGTLMPYSEPAPGVGPRYYRVFRP